MNTIRGRSRGEYKGRGRGRGTYRGTYRGEYKGGSGNRKAFYPSSPDINLITELLEASLNDDIFRIKDLCKKRGKNIRNNLKPEDYAMIGLIGYSDKIPCIKPHISRESIDRNMTKYILGIYPRLIDYVPETRDSAYIVAKLIKGDKLASKDRIIMKEDQEFVIFRHIIYLYEDNNDKEIEFILRSLWGNTVDKPNGIINNKREQRRKLILDFSILLLILYGSSNIWEQFHIKNTHNIVIRKDGYYESLINYLRERNIISQLYNIEFSIDENNTYISSALLSTIEYIWALDNKESHDEGKSLLNDMSNSLIKDPSNTWFYCGQYRDYKNVYIVPGSISRFINISRDNWNPPKNRIWSLSNNKIYRVILYNISIYPGIYQDILNPYSVPDICGNLARSYWSLFEEDPAKIIRSSLEIAMISSRIIIDKFRNILSKKIENGNIRYAAVSSSLSADSMINSLPVYQ